MRAMPREAKSERVIQREILSYLATRKDLRACRMNTGAATHRKSGVLVRFGVPGQADIMGILAPHGQLLAIEVKSKSGRQSSLQESFQEMVRKFGGIYILARSVKDVASQLPDPTAEP